MARRGLVVALLALAVGSFSDAARAADKDDTSFELGLYMWGVGVYGDVDTPKGEISNNTSFSDIWDNLSGAVMAHGRLQSGRFSVVSDLLYADLETDRQHKNFRLGPHGGIHVQADAKAELKMWVVDLNAGYEIFDLQDVMWKPRAELFAGARYWSFSPEIDVNLSGPLASRSRDIDPTETWVDGLVGARFALALSPTVELSAQGDIGGFGIGNSSEAAWMQATLLSWHFAERWRLFLGYKFLQFRRDTGDVELRQQFRGPIVATSITF